MNDLGRHLAVTPAPPAVMRIGTVTDYPPLIITLGDGAEIPNVRRLASFTPTIGDQVAVLCQGSDVLVLGRIA